MPARTIAQIQAAIWAGVLADPVIGTGGTNPLNSTSKVAIYLAWSWIVATVHWVLENNFYSLMAQITANMAADKSHKVGWYATMAMAFQYGDSLPSGSDVYNPVAPAGDPSLIVTYAVAIEEVNYVRIKVATGEAGSLSALSSGQLTALTAYFEPPNGVKDAGVRLEITSGAGDNLQSAMVVYYDPLVLTDTGARIDGSAATPVEDAINAYLFSLSFATDANTGVNVPVNLPFDFNEFVAAIMAVEGVETVDVTVCQANYASTPYVNIIAASPQEYTADAGYLVLDGTYFGANVEYVPYV